MFPELTLEYRVIIGISAMVLLFSGFLISFITSQRKKLLYHKELQRLNEEQQEYLKQQNMHLEQRVAERTRELNEQKEALQSSLTHLKATQIQLIQKEKMASLGELTSGIAHEIQNPLNFITNFSEVSSELVEELMHEFKSGHTEYVMESLPDLMENLKKIKSHGKRADAIVKGMLEHSRVYDSERSPTPLNAMVEEYLRLTHQSRWAKEDGFRCEIMTDFDPEVGSIEMVASEIGRVLLNVFNNAFYAIKQRQLLENDQYTPTLWVSTSRQGSRIVIKVRDNGTGMPHDVMKKIFQPFFTTKPTGEGTGLGLSLSYDIVTQGHGGEMIVNSTEGKGTEMQVVLPG